MDGVKQCNCGKDEWAIESDDNVTKIICQNCGEVYFHDEIADLPNYEDS